MSATKYSDRGQGGKTGTCLHGIGVLYFKGEAGGKTYRLEIIRNSRGPAITRGREGQTKKTSGNKNVDN